MPKENGDSGLDAIIKKYALKRDQVSRQLRNWKDKVYLKTQETLVLDPGDVEGFIKDAMSVERVLDFVIELLGDIAAGREVTGSPDATVLQQSIKDHVSSAERVVVTKYLHDHPTHKCNALLVEYAEFLTKTAAEIFSKCAAELTSVELDFKRKNTVKRSSHIKQWLEEYTDINEKEAVLGKSDFGHLGIFLFNCIYFSWCRLLVADDVVEIEFPERDLVAPYSLEVVYYVAGWSLQRTSLALKAPEGERHKYYSFALKHSITQQKAKDDGLPSGLVERRQKKTLFFPSQQFFDFIRLKTRTKFSALFEDVSESTEEDRLAILDYILERYVHMRGFWFVKYMKNNTSKSLGETRADNVQTRTKVAAKHCTAKAVSIAVAKTKEERADEEKKQLFASAAENLIGLENDDVEDGDRHQDEEEYTYEESDDEQS
ncbi:hypothetical protein THAOC_19554 [Thalassiosira oceanica]|uniref:Uncharacterized protein n=1 Tax=Thalassiosira oceanica TaxID=159749 RepID=K0S4F5_THAOC|nr:hypothetical protein THAOC_19554 [Thalassiosira oceanica]|eukprot:EJK60145.1 hypothetical protein THAOC_19554 [Thalassiosira oceanica]